MNSVKEIVKKYLDDNHFNGLCCDDCACEKDDLFPCQDFNFENCRPGIKMFDENGEYKIVDLDELWANAQKLLDSML